MLTPYHRCAIAKDEAECISATTPGDWHHTSPCPCDKVRHVDVRGDA
jgi:hypothetical protein